MTFNMGKHISVRCNAGHILGCLLLGIIINLSLGVKIFGITIIGSIILAIICSIILLLHEIGHVLLSVRDGIPAHIELTFLGGYATVHTSDLKTKRAAILNGPMFSMACCLLVAPIIYPFSLYFAAITLALGITLNLMNLIPLYPLDGSMIVATTLIINDIDARWFFIIQAITLLLIWTIGLYLSNFIFPFAMTVMFIASILQKILVTNE